MFRGLEETQRKMREVRTKLSFLVSERQKKVNEVRRIDQEIIKERELQRALYQQVVEFNRNLRRISTRRR